MGPEKEKIVLYVVTKSNWGGAQRYVYDLALEASGRGYAPIVACGGEGLLTKRLAERRISTRRIHSLERSVSILKDLRCFFEIRRIIRSIHPAIVHVNSSKAGGIGALAARACGVACVVFTAHGLPQHEARTWIVKKIISCLTWLTALLAHRVIAVARGDAELLRREPFLRQRVRHIPNGIEHHGCDRKTAREMILRHIPEPEARETLAHALWIGTVAELTYNKGHRYALEALSAVRRLFPAVAYIIVGDGELAESHKSFVKKHELENHVFFTGFIPHASELFSAFDIYLAPSIKEGLPYTIIEAMASGSAIVASSVGGVPDLIVDGVSGTLIAPRSSAAATRALIPLLEDSAYRSLLGEHARQAALHTYTKVRMAEETFALYDACAHLPHAARA